MRLKDILNERELTMSQFAEMCGYSYNALYQQVKSPSYPTLQKWAQVLNVPVYELFVDPKTLMQSELDKIDDFTAYVRYKGIHYTADTYNDFVKITEELAAMHNQ